MASGITISMTEWIKRLKFRSPNLNFPCNSKAAEQNRYCYNFFHLFLQFVKLPAYNIKRVVLFVMTIESFRTVLVCYSNRTHILFLRGE